MHTFQERKYLLFNGENQIWNEKHRNYMPHMWQKMEKMRSLLNPQTLYIRGGKIPQKMENNNNNNNKFGKKKTLVILEGVGECWV
jgi:hypothetical protein